MQDIITIPAKRILITNNYNNNNSSNNNNNNTVAKRPTKIEDHAKQ